MPRPHHHERKPEVPEKESFWYSGLGMTLIVLAVCLVLAPLYMALDAVGAFTFTGLVVIFVGFWAIVITIAWFLPNKPKP